MSVWLNHSTLYYRFVSTPSPHQVESAYLLTTFSLFRYTASSGLCPVGDTENSKLVTSITFGAGTSKYSTATPASFGFTTTYNQLNAAPLTDDHFSFVNQVPADYPTWHAGALDHSPDLRPDGSTGYMMVVGADDKPGEVIRLPVHNLCRGARYEFSAYVANVVKKGSNLIKPNVRFEARTATSDNTLIASVSSGDMDEYSTLTWQQYGMSFYAPTTSIVLLMISNAPGGAGNDFVVDDITLGTCASAALGACAARKFCVVDE